MRKGTERRRKRQHPTKNPPFMRVLGARYFTAVTNDSTGGLPHCRHSSEGRTARQPHVLQGFPATSNCRSSSANDGALQRILTEDRRQIGNRKGDTLANLGEPLLGYPLTDPCQLGYPVTVGAA